jgi:hypothetical protein
MAGDLKTNLRDAQLAVSHVRQKAKLVANWDGDLPGSAENIGNTLLRQGVDEDVARELSERAFDAADQCVYHELRQEPDWQRINNQVGGVNSLEDIKKLAKLAAKHGCGNCGELTSLAFMFLFNKGVRPLDFMALSDPADHAFVVIGRGGSRADDGVGQNWGEAAVVCDPWAPGLEISLGYDDKGKPIQGPVERFGETFAAYAAKFLGAKMKAMHPQFVGVRLPPPFRAT